MLPLVLGLLIFLGVHLIPTSPGLKDSLTGRFGAGVYKVAFSLASAVGFVLIVLGYHKLQIMPGKNPVLWDPPAWTRHITMLLMLPAMILLVASQIPSRIRTAAKHPMLASIKLWALAHLLANGDLGSILLFGSFLAYGVYDRISVKRRGSAGPLGAKTGAPLNDVIVVVLGLALYGFMVVWGHENLIGMPLISASFAP